jgi:acyl carrier protein
MPLTREKLLQQMQDKLGVDTRGIDNDTVLFSSGLMDSFTMVELIMVIEGETGSRLSPLDVNLENFDSLGRIMKFVDRIASTS